MSDLLSSRTLQNVSELSVVLTRVLRRDLGYGQHVHNNEQITMTFIALSFKLILTNCDLDVNMLKLLNVYFNLPQKDLDI